MCVRTKTSYGCGHEFRTTNECGSSRCADIERYHYPRDGDCRDCKRGGDGVTRGRDGKGRYGRELSRKSSDREAFREPVIEDLSGDFDDLSLDVGGGISPWAPPQKNEKNWAISPTRRKADDAWLEEHTQRHTYLQSVRDTMSTTSSSDHTMTNAKSSGYRDRAMVPSHLYYNERDYDDGNQYSRRRMDMTERNLQVEIRSLQDEYDHRDRRPSHSHPSRHDSQESFESVPRSRSSSHRYQTKPTTTSYAYEYRDSGYGSYGDRASNGYESSSTEPYMYSSQPRMIKVRAPSVQSYNVYHTGFGVSAPVDVIARAPVYSYRQRRH